jgi:hypothetical protein
MLCCHYLKYPLLVSLADSMNINLIIANNDQVPKYIYTTGVTPAGAAKEGDKTILLGASCIVG